jgi:hypothetical protein
MLSPSFPLPGTDLRVLKCRNVLLQLVILPRELFQSPIVVPFNPRDVGLRLRRKHFVDVIEFNSILPDSRRSAHCELGASTHEH